MVIGRDRAQASRGAKLPEPPQRVDYMLSDGIKKFIDIPGPIPDAYPFPPDLEQVPREFAEAWVDKCSGLETLVRQMAIAMAAAGLELPSTSGARMQTQRKRMVSVHENPTPHPLVIEWLTTWITLFFQNAIRNSSLEMAAMEQLKADENVLKLAEDQKRQKEDLLKRIIQLEKQLDVKQAIELEIEQLRGSLNVKKHIRDDGDMEVVNKVDSLHKMLREKERDLDDLEALNQTLIVKERKSNDELQDARKELVNGLKEMSTGGEIGIKRMGELDNKPFHEAMKRKYNEADAEDRAIEVCSLWEEFLRDPEWHPFRVITVNGVSQEVIDEEDEKLNGLRDEYGVEAYNAVTTALKEINEYNPSARDIISELWNYSEWRKATLQEGLAVLTKIYKRRRIL